MEKQSKPECVVEAVPEDASRPDGPTDLYLVFDGKRIAKRGKPGTLHAMTWIPLEPGVVVRDLPMPESESGWGMVVRPPMLPKFADTQQNWLRSRPTSFWPVAARPSVR